MIDYALWEVIDNGATLLKTQVVESVTTVMPITTIEEKAQGRLEVKGKSTLMMGILNEHQLKFKSIKDAKQLQKLVSQLKLLDERLSQEDVNQKLLRSLSPEWNTHVVVWRNKVDLDTISMDDLYNNLKSYQAEEGPNYALIDISSSRSDSKIVDNCKKGLGYENYNAVPPSYTGNVIPPTPDLSSTVTKDETSGILKSFRTMIENLVDHKVKVIRCDNRIEFKKREMDQFRKMKEAVNTACYVQNRVLVVKPHNKTPYELFHDRTPTLCFLRPFGCPVTILNTIDHLGKFDGKANEGFFVGYSLNSKAFRVFNSITRIMKENLHIRFSENTHNIVGSGPDWLFDVAALARTMNYEPISSYDDGSKPSSDDVKKVDEDPRKETKCKYQEKEDNVNSTNNVNIVSLTVNTAGTNEDNELSFDPNMPALEDVSIFNFSNDDEDNGIVADINNLDTTIQVSFIPTTRIHKDHPLDQVIGDVQSAIQIRNMTKNLEEHGFVDDIIFGLTKKELCNAFERLMHEKFQMSSMGELTFFLGLQVKQKKDGIFISQDKYVAKILKKFRPDIKFAVCACARYQVNPKIFHLYAVKRIFRYLKGQPKLGLWYLKDSSLDLVAYTDSDYHGASLDRKSTTRGYQFLGCRLISWQCKKLIVVANSTTEAEYVAASSCYG
nr:hypothetical protein [Tanacetum cinerariifolium]